MKMKIMEKSTRPVPQENSWEGAAMKMMIMEKSTRPVPQENN